MLLDEREAVARLQRGDIGGLEALVHAYHARAVRTAYLVTQDLAAAHDIAQAAFVKAYERIERFDPNRPFGPWFLKGVLRDALKAATRQQRHLPLDALTGGAELAGLEPADLETGPERLWEQRELAETIMGALAQLPPAERVAIVQRYYLDLSEAEMMAAADCPAGTVKWRLHAARARLRALLAPLKRDSEVL